MEEETLLERDIKRLEKWLGCTIGDYLFYESIAVFLYFIIMKLCGKKNAFKWALLGYAGYVEMLIVMTIVAVVSRVVPRVLEATILKKRKIVADLHEMSDKIETLGLSIKNMINSLPRVKFEALRGNYLKKLDGDYVSKGAHRLKEILETMELPGKTFVDLCAGRGGWSQVLHENGKRGTAISYWDMHEQHEKWEAQGSASTIREDIRKVEPWKTDIVVFEGGESNPNARQEESRYNDLLSVVCRWIELNPKCSFIIKVTTPWSARTRHMLKSIMHLTGKGYIRRLDMSRLTNMDMYFTSEGLDVKIDQRIKEELDKHLHALNKQDTYEDSFTSGSIPVWTKTIAEAEKLGSYVYTNAVQMFLTDKEGLRKPRNITNFYKELGWRPTQASGSGSSVRNDYTGTLVGILKQHLPNFASWMSTSTTPGSTFKVFLDKVDKPPVEEHEYYDWLKVAYSTMADYLVKQSGPMRRLKPEEYLPTLNRNGAMGFQERDLKWGTRTVSNIGEYIDSGLWKKRLAKAKQELRQPPPGGPKLIVFNSTGKKEKKMYRLKGRAKGSRLIWFLPATMRIFEAEVFGDIENKLKYMPYTVTGMPLYDYGETLSRIMKSKVAICNDIAGFDTRISKGQQAISLEYFYKKIAEQELHQDMEDLFRIYTNPVVAVEREIKGQAELCFMQGRGQVASGRRPTYAGNTIDNIAMNMVAVANTQGVSKKNFSKWIKEQLGTPTKSIRDVRNRTIGHTSKFGGVFSGDDSVLVLSRENAERFAEHGHKVLNAVGWYRKNMEPDDRSVIVENLRDVEFCSHQFAPVIMKDIHGEQITRWMPCRPVEEIMAKAALVIGKPKDKGTEEALARAHGLQLLVNYFHIPEVRALSLALLSCTRPGLTLLGLDKGYNVRAQPWLNPGGVMDIVNECLFGRSTCYPVSWRAQGLKSLGYLEFEDRGRFFMPQSDDRKRRSVRRAWYINLVEAVKDLREPNVHYEDWYKEMVVLTRNYGMRHEL